MSHVAKRGAERVGTRDAPYTAWIERGSATIAYACARCGEVHRRRRRSGEGVGALANRQTHCPADDPIAGVWLRLVASDRPES
jgi:hypothetical protein